MILASTMHCLKYFELQVYSSSVVSSVLPYYGKSCYIKQNIKCSWLIKENTILILLHILKRHCNLKKKNMLSKKYMLTSLNSKLGINRIKKCNKNRELQYTQWISRHVLNWTNDIKSMLYNKKQLRAR